MKTISRVMLVAIVAAAPLYAQGGGAGRGGAPPARIDTSATRRTPDGAVLDFKDADIAVVLGAIAEAGNLNVNMNNMPSAKVTLRVSATMTKETATEMLKMIAEGNGVTVTESPSIIRLVGPPKAPAPPTPQQQISAQQAAYMAQQNRTRELHVVRLKHATASTIAPLLMSLLRGTGAGGTGVGVGRGGIAGLPTVTQGFNPAAAGGGGNGRGGRGGGGGANPAIQGGFGGTAGGGRAGNPAITAITQALGLGGGQAALGFGMVNLAFSDINIVADGGTNSLLILATAEDFQAITPIVQSVDLRPLQVLIEVTIAEVERSNDLNLGISGVTTKAGSTTATTGTTTTNAAGVTSKTSTSTTTGRTDTTGVFPGAATARDFIAQLIGGTGSVNYAVAINALQSRGDVKVLSLPLIIAQNNQQAVLNVGSKVPFVQVSQTVVNDPTGRVQTVQYQDVGTTLTITPTINTDGYVNLAVIQTSDNLTNNVQFDAQIINTRQAQTQVFVRDGQTTVIGGLTDNTTSNSRAGIPILSRIPFIGGLLFGNSQRSKTTSELFLFLTPHIVSSDADIDRLRNAVQGGSDLLREIPLQHINPGGDTIKVGVQRGDTVKRRPPPPDSTKRPPPPPADSTGVQYPSPGRDEPAFPSRNVPWLPNRESPIG